MRPLKRLPTATDTPADIIAVATGVGIMAMATGIRHYGYGYRAYPYYGYGYRPYGYYGYGWRPGITIGIGRGWGWRY